MAPSASRADLVKVWLRRAAGTCLRLVPLTVIGYARRRHLLVPLLRHRSIAGLGHFTVASNPPVELAAVDSRLVRLLYWYGEDGYEGWEAHWWRQLCRAATGILEVGANVGYYTVHGALAAPTASYTAVEANPESAAIVRRNLELNGLARVRLLESAAVGAGGPHTVELALPALEHYVAPTGAFLATGTEGVGERRPRGRTVVVPTVAAPTLVDGVDLIKLDIEGAEHVVLESVIDQLIGAQAVILVEVLRDTPKLRDLLARLVPHGYRFWSLGSQHPREITLDELRDTDLVVRFGSRDVAAMPGSRTPQ